MMKRLQTMIPPSHISDLVARLLLAQKQRGEAAGLYEEEHRAWDRFEMTYTKSI